VQILHATDLLNSETHSRAWLANVIPDALNVHVNTSIARGYENDFLVKLEHWTARLGELLSRCRDRVSDSDVLHFLVLRW